jgi:acetyl-CoA synthetase
MQEFFTALQAQANPLATPSQTPRPGEEAPVSFSLELKPLKENAQNTPAFWEPFWQQLGLPHASLGVNKAEVCLQVNNPALQNKTALVWVPKSFASNPDVAPEIYTFGQLNTLSNQFANLLATLNVAPGDRVFLFMERIPELYTAFLGALKVQALVTPIFAAFGPEAILDRALDAKPVLFITTPALQARLTEVLEATAAWERPPHVLVVNPQQAVSDLPGERYHCYQTLLAGASSEFTPAYTKPETPSVMHYTSGTTGKPKGAVHTHQAVVAQAATSALVLDLKPDDVYWCTADPGWVTGTAYGMFGPWALGTTQLVYEGGFCAETWYQLLETYKVSVWYTAPTAIRMLMKQGNDLPARFAFKALRHLASVGEPLNPEALLWGKQVFKGLSFYDTWWQTETGCQHIVNLPGQAIIPGSMGKPLPGVQAAVLSERFEPMELPATLQGVKAPGLQEVTPFVEGLLALKSASPSFFSAYWQQPEKYQSRFKNGWYLTGDRARLDANGYFWFVGRDDDVINTAGHLVGPFEVESVLIEHPAVAEAGVIGLPDDERLEIVAAYVSLKNGFNDSPALQTELMQFVRTRLAAHAQPRSITVIEGLPKTRSGKIMRRVLKATALGHDLGDTSTLEE